jgi:hypothetical protein
LHQLEDGERVEADDGLRGMSPQFAKCPSSLAECEAMQQKVRSRHETGNKRFKQWKLLKSIYKGKIEHHGSYFQIAAIVTQLNINYGERLFDVEYEDPHYDTYHYFDESDDESDGDYE